MIYYSMESISLSVECTCTRRYSSFAIFKPYAACFTSSVDGALGFATRGAPLLDPILSRPEARVFQAAALAHLPHGYAACRACAGEAQQAGRGCWFSSGWYAVHAGRRLIAPVANRK